MTDKQYVLQEAHKLGIYLYSPNRDCAKMIGTHWVDGVGKNVIDAATWAEAKEQINKYAQQRANS